MTHIMTPPPFHTTQWIAWNTQVIWQRCGPNTQNETYIKMTHLLNFIYFLYKLRFSPKKLQQWLKLDSSLLKAVYWAVECVL